MCIWHTQFVGQVLPYKWPWPVWGKITSPYHSKPSELLVLGRLYRILLTRAFNRYRTIFTPGLTQGYLWWIMTLIVTAVHIAFKFGKHGPHDKTFLCHRIEWSGAYCFVLSDCLFVCLFVCLSTLTFAITFKP